MNDDTSVLVYMLGFGTVLVLLYFISVQFDNRPCDCVCVEPEPVYVIKTAPDGTRYVDTGSHSVVVSHPSVFLKGELS